MKIKTLIKNLKEIPETTFSFGKAYREFSKREKDALCAAIDIIKDGHCRSCSGVGVEGRMIVYSPHSERCSACSESRNYARWEWRGRTDG